jgi:hypothetical protein
VVLPRAAGTVSRAADRGRARPLPEVDHRPWPARPERIAQAAVDHYVAALDDATIAATCADYRASFHLDRPLDAADRAAGRRIEQPRLVLWGALDEGFSDDAGPLDVWRQWAERVEGVPIPAGHFIPEEAAAELFDALTPFLSARSADRRPDGQAARTAPAPRRARATGGELSQRQLEASRRIREVFLEGRDAFDFSPRIEPLDQPP